MNKAELIMHPIRFRILRLLDRETLTTFEIGQKLDDVPNSSIYRHLKLLLNGGMIEISETRLVNGIQEKTYHLAQPASLGPDDVAAWTAEEHIRYFTSYVMTLLNDYATYAAEAEALNGFIDMVSDRVGYREIAFWVTKEELDLALGKVNEAILPLLSNKEDAERKLYKLATVLHPQCNE